MNRKKDLKKLKIDDLTKDYEANYLKHCNKDLRCERIKNTMPSELPSFNTTNSASQSVEDYKEKEVLEQFSLLQALQKKERELKVKILHEQYMKEDLITTDETIFSDKISELQAILQEREAHLKMQNIMRSKIQLTGVLQNVTQSFCKKNNEDAHKSEIYEDEIERNIFNLMLRKKEIEKEISVLQQEIADVEEKCLKIRKIIENSVHEKANDDQLDEANNIATDSKDYKELERLKAENQKRNERIKLLARTLHILITNIESDCVKEDLKSLAASCESILNWNCDNIDEMEEMCLKVSSTTI